MPKRNARVKATKHRDIKVLERAITLLGDRANVQASTIEQLQQSVADLSALVGRLSAKMDLVRPDLHEGAGC